MITKNRIAGLMIAAVVGASEFVGLGVGNQAQAGVIFEYVGGGNRATDVFGFIEFKDGVAANVGDNWTLADVEAFELNHGAFSFSSTTDPGFLQTGPGEFSADNPFENFDATLNPVLFANSILGSNDAIITIHKIGSALLVNDDFIGVHFEDPVTIIWSRVAETAEVPEPALFGIVVAGAIGIGFIRRRRK
jgi:hypothetical protein